MSKTTIVLFTYGGGMRGLVPAHIMERIEDATGLQMADMIDIFTGPSTGAILNAALNVPHPDKPGRPKYRARHLIRFYEREGRNIFPADRFRDFRGLIHDFNNRTMKIGQLRKLFRHGHYDPAHLASSLRALYGETSLADSLRSLIIPVYNIEGRSLDVVEEPGETGDSPVHTRNNFFLDGGGYALWLKNMVHEGAVPGHRPAPDVALFDAVMASCAAPTYFPCHHFRANFHGRSGEKDYAGIDGSIFDNPCISYLGAIRRHVPQDHRLIMIVLGTGYTNKPIRKEDWNRYGALGVVDPVNELPLIKILFHASESALMDTFAEEMGANLFVFNTPMFGRTDMDAPSEQIDDASPENLRRLHRFAEGIIEENRASFDRLCHLLTGHHDRREKAGKFRKMWLFGG